MYQCILNLLADTLISPRLFKSFSCGVSRRANLLSKIGMFTCACFKRNGFHSIFSIKKGWFHNL